MVENQNVNINLIYNYVMAGFTCSRGQPSRCATAQGPPTARGLQQPNKCIAYPRTLYPKENTLAWPKLYPDLTCTGYSQHGLYLGLKRSRPDYSRVYYG